MNAAQRKRLVDDIVRKYGNVIDLKKTPNVLVEILQEHGDISQTGGGGGSGGVGSVSTVAGGMGSGSSLNKRAGDEIAQINEVMRAVLDLRKDVRGLTKQVRTMNDSIASGNTRG